MARETTKWPSTRWPITKIMSSDGCNGNRVPLEMGPWYDFREFGCHLGNVDLDRVLSWPPKRQQDAVEILEGIEDQDSIEFQLTDEQLAEVSRRRTDPDPKTLTLAEFDKRLRRFGV